MKAFDRKGLAERIDRLLAAPSLARTLGERGREQARAWCDEDRYFDGVLEILEAAIERRSGVTRSEHGNAESA